MIISRSRIAASLAAMVALSMTASPAFAHGYRDWHHRHRDGGGDLLAGLLIGGAIVAIASAAGKSDANPARDDQAYDPAEDRDYARVPPMARAEDGGRADVSFDGAVDACSGEIERGERRIGSVDNVRRMGERFSVEGHLEDGRGYACSIDETGRIRSVSIDGHAMI